MRHAAVGALFAVSAAACGDAAVSASGGNAVDAGAARDAGSSGTSIATDSGTTTSADAGGDADASTGVSFPDPDWPTGAPEDFGIDSSGLDTADDVADQHSSFCLLVIRHGTLVWEKYFGGHDATSTDPSWSIAKSYSSALVGIAIDRGEIHSLDDSVAAYVPSWVGTPMAAVTIRNLVTMTSGLHWDMFSDYVTMAELAPDKTSYALAQPLDDPPGSKWTYDNAGVQVLEPVIRAATGMAMDDYARKYLWSKIGMHGAWDHDDAGHPTAYANVRATCRDHARFGYLYLHGGSWEGTQVIPSSWVTDSTTPSQSINRGYGNLFWVNGSAPAEDAMMESFDGWISPIAPADMFAARGFGNQFIDVIPSLDLIVVRFGADPMAKFDIPTLLADARFSVHDEIMAPILDAVH
ncbi:MAG: serine hydrolase domain-containing protein [Polyangiaceae bacterium]